VGGDRRAERDERGEDATRIVLGRAHEEIDVAGRPHHAVSREGVRADDDELGLLVEI